MKSEIISRLQRRFKKHFPETSWQEVEDYFHFSQMERINCYYCTEELERGYEFPYSKNPSIDHKQPLSRNGLNSFDNVAISCTRCNIVKGTMTEQTYKNFLTLLNSKPEWKETIMNEMFLGRLADKLRREGKQKKPEEPVELFKYV